MKHRIRALGIGALIAIGVAAFSASATATSGGHFVSGSEHTSVQLVASGAHSFAWINSNGAVSCGSHTHEGTVFGTTVASIELTPIWKESCTTGDGTPMVFTHNGCTFKFTVASGTTSSTEQTLHLGCPVGKVFELDQGGTCLVTMPSQTAGSAATYTTTEANGKHAITVSLSATLETQFHAGLCVFLGTKQFTTLKGSGVLRGFDTSGQPVSLTAT